jgi:AraC-like DNA-binding protein
MNKDLLKENREHGDVMFPFKVYNMTCPTGSTVLDCHWHDELEFLTVTHGKAIFQIDSAYYEVSAGQAIFVESGEIHAGYQMDGCSCSFNAVVFNPDLLCSRTFDVLQSKYIDPVLKRQYLLPKHIKVENIWEKEALAQLSQLILSGSAKSDAYELEVKAHLLLLFSILITNSNPSAGREYSPANYQAERIKTALKYIQENYANKISTKDLSEFLNLSEGHFCRLFKKMVKKTPMDYLNYYRVNKALRLLSDTDKKVIDVAMEVGFDNFSYFISTFKHYMMCTPAKYRTASQPGKI